MPENLTLQVSQAIEVINQSLEQTLPFLQIEGEVSGFKVNQNKFVFFDIKDAVGSLGCFMMVFKLKFPLTDGMRVRILAQPKITNWGKFSLTVHELMPVGEGSLKKSFELLKKKLAAEGLFDDSRKRPLPPVPRRIGIVSSSGAAGYADFLKVLSNRWGSLELVLADVPVQGMEAPTQLVGAINFLNELAEPLDVIAVIRGGGSLDDLSAFNHEDVVRAISLSRTPVIVGVGHETDISLSDLAADRRAATPSNAAELVVPDKNEVMLRAKRLNEKASNGVEAAVRVFEVDVEATRITINDALNNLFTEKSNALKNINRTLLQIDPAAVLRRGYSLVRKGQALLTDVENVILGDEIAVQLYQGSLSAKVTHVDQKN